MLFWQGADGIRITGDAWGDPRSPLVVLLHGAGQTRHSWRNTGDLLGFSGYYAVAFDARGHGDSDWSTDAAYGHDVMVEDLRCVVAALGQRRPVLVGASMGGITSLMAVGEDHIDASALVLVDIAPRIEGAGVSKIHEFMSQKPEGFNSLDEVSDAIASYQPHRPHSNNLDGLLKNVRLGADGKYHWHWDPRFLNRPRDSERREKRLEACLRRLVLPTLLVRGGLSDVLSEEGVRHFLALCPHAEYINVANAGHMVAGDRNDVFGTSVIEFLVRTTLLASDNDVDARRAQPTRSANRAK